MSKKKYCLALDLKDDAHLIEAYKAQHQQVWPEIIQSIKDSGISLLDIYCVGNRLFMVIEAEESFSFEAKAASDAANPTVQEWEMLMWRFQKPLPWAEPGEKWVLMEKIFELP